MKISQIMVVQTVSRGKTVESVQTKLLILGENAFDHRSFDVDCEYITSKDNEGQTNRRILSPKPLAKAPQEVLWLLREVSLGVDNFVRKYYAHLSINGPFFKNMDEALERNADLNWTGMFEMNFEETSVKIGGTIIPVTDNDFCSFEHPNPEGQELFAPYIPYFVKAKNNLENYLNKAAQVK